MMFIAGFILGGLVAAIGVFVILANQMDKMVRLQELEEQEALRELEEKYHGR